MSREKEGQKPYQKLGEKLRALRELHKETLAEVCGAVEIDSDQLTEFETGIKRPPEEILFLLSSHFKSTKKQTDRLFSLAGYQKITESNKEPDMPADFAAQPAMMVLPIDSRIVYTDSANVSANNHGVVLSFMQNAGPKGQPLAISKVGMSREHAKNLVDLLQKTLDHISDSPKQLKPKDQPKKAQ